jgi:hypothetical protein
MLTSTAASISSSGSSTLMAFDAPPDLATAAPVFLLPGAESPPCQQHTKVATPQHKGIRNWVQACSCGTVACWLAIAVHMHYACVSLSTCCNTQCEPTSSAMRKTSATQLNCCQNTVVFCPAQAAAFTAAACCLNSCRHSRLLATQAAPLQPQNATPAGATLLSPLELLLLLLYRLAAIQPNQPTHRELADEVLLQQLARAVAVPNFLKVLRGVLACSRQQVGSGNTCAAATAAAVGATATCQQ